MLSKILIFCHNIHVEAEYPHCPIISVCFTVCMPSEIQTSSRMKTSRTLTAPHLALSPFLAGVVFILTLAPSSPAKMFPKREVMNNHS
jgi:hypothetical protein